MVPRIASPISAVVALVSLGFTACSPSNSEFLVTAFGPGAVVAVVVSPSSATVQVGLSIQMNATVVGSVVPQTAGDVSWVSSNSIVASVSSAGLVTGMRAGATTITASHSDISDAATVTVVEAPPPPS